MNDYKKYLIFSFIFPIPILMLLAINLYLYDPVQLFHKPYFRKVTFFNDMRISAKGIIAWHDFDSYIVGTSMLENTSAREAKEKLGGEWVNISMCGTSYTERAVVLEYLFSTKAPKQIIYSLEVLADVWWGEIKLPEFLYNGIRLDDLRFYINDTFIQCSLTWSLKKRCVGDKEEIENLTKWHENEFKKYGGVENWTMIRLSEPINELEPFFAYQGALEKPKFSQETHAKIQETITNNILRFVIQNPNTQFHFIIPTYSRAIYKARNTNLAQLEATLLWLASNENLPNATLYGFDDLDYADEIANYKDTTHYNRDMNSMHLDAIRDRAHILTPENIRDYIKTMETKIENYDVEPLIRELKRQKEIYEYDTIFGSKKAQEARRFRR